MAYGARPGLTIRILAIDTGKQRFSLAAP